MSFPNLSALAVRERSVTLFFIILSICAGIYAFLTMGRAEDPTFVPRVMVVSTIWPGATPTEIKNQVVDRLEKRIQEIQYLRKIETTIQPGRADLQVEFEDYSPQDMVQTLFYEVRKRMLDEQANLPSGVIGPIIQDDFSDVFFSLVALSAPGMPMRELTREAEAIRDRMQQLDGLQKALVIGERPERMFIDFDMNQLNNLGLTPAQIFAAIDASNHITPAGFIDLDGPRAYMRVDADLADPQQLAAVPLRIGKQLIKLSDIAKVHRGYQDPPTYLIRANGEDTVLLGAVMQASTNGLEFGERLEDFLRAEQEQLPLGMSLVILSNQTDAIRKAINLFQIKFLVAMFVVIAVSVIAIGFRAGLVVGITIPLTIGLALLIMKLADINLDRITLGALIIALGLLVDDAIIAIEMMIVKMEEGWDRVRAASHAWNVTAAPMLFGTLVTAVGFLPIGFARSGVGEYAGNIFWVLAYALLVSWIVAVTFTPYLGVKLLPDYPRHDAGQLYQTPLYQRLRKLITGCVTQRQTVVATTVSILIMSIALLATQVEKQFFPGSDRPEVMVSIYLPQGSAINSTDQVVRRMEALAANIDGVENVSAYVGAGSPRFFLTDHPQLPNAAYGRVLIMGTDAKARDHIMRTIEQHVATGEFPEARVRVTRLLFGPPVAWPVIFRVFGPDEDELRRIGHQVRDVMVQHPNTVIPHLEWDERTPTYQLEMDAERLRLMGLTPNDVAAQLQLQLSGQVVAEVRQDIRRVAVIARSKQTQAISPENLEIKTGEGHKLPLMQLGELKIRYEDPIIKRFNRSPFVSVQSEVSGAQAPDVATAIWQQLEPIRNNLPHGYRIEIGGAIEESVKADLSIQKLQPLMLALVLIFIMLQMRSFSGTFMVFATAPLGVVGASLALFIFKQPFGFTALLGLIGLGGILMRNTMILTQQVQDNLAAGMNEREAVIEAAVQRARPVVLTALAAVFAFVPLTLDKFWGPLAYALIGGVAIGTLITLLFVPALYALWFKIAKT